jgi:hypothetical protein
MKPVGVVSTTPFETSDPRTSVEARACQLGGNVVWPLPSTRGQRDTRFLVLRDENTVASL